MPYKTLHTYQELKNETEIKKLTTGADYRDPKYRKEVFMKFYEFHLKYASHPGCVYYLMPYIVDSLNLDTESKYWLAYINGVTQNLCTSLVILKNFPDYKSLDLNHLENWHSKNWRLLDYDTDRRYQKGHLVKMIKNYKEVVGESQVKYFNRFFTFDDLWEEVINKFFMFGRLSTFSYLEYIRIMGKYIEPNHLFLDDYTGSMSHRNGLLKVIGRDDLDQHKSNPMWNGKDKIHTPDIIEGCKVLGEELLDNAKSRFQGRTFYGDVNYFTLESTLCTYKSWFRKNRRYPNVYNDMFYLRIKKAEENWKHKPKILEELKIFWKARKHYLPTHLRVEDSQYDPGLCPVKQNHFRETGEVLMMGEDFPEFKNNFFNKINECTLWQNL